MDSAKELWDKWQKELVLKQDENPAFYVYQQEFELLNGKVNKRTGFVGALEVEPFSKKTIMPHERTFSKIKGNRKDLLHKCQANFGHIFVLYNDPEKTIDRLLEEVTKGKTTLEYVDENKVTHRIWTITDLVLIGKIQGHIKHKLLFIADGHHRYGASLEYKEEQKSELADAYTGREGFNSRMVTLVNINNPGIVILPTHRVVYGMDNLNKEQLVEDLKKYFFVDKVTIQDMTMLEPWLETISQAREEHAIGMYFGGEDYYTIKLKSSGSMGNILGISKPQEWLDLDVTILHYLVLKHVLNIDTQESKEDSGVKYIRNPHEAISRVSSGDAKIAFILNSVTPEALTKIVELGELMPQKSTDFYPKLNTGLVMRSLENSEVLAKEKI